MSPAGDPVAGLPGDTLADLFERLARELADVSLVDSPNGSEFRRGDRPFAALAGPGVEVRLHLEVAEAATRTSHSTLSRRGPGWVRFEPPSVDTFALDRAGAWFLSAWRAAER